MGYKALIHVFFIFFSFKSAFFPSLQPLLCLFSYFYLFPITLRVIARFFVSRVIYFYHENFTKFFLFIDPPPPI